MKDGFTNGFDVPDDQRERHYDVFEEVVLMAAHLRQHGVLTQISERLRFARRRFGRYEVIDFLAVLLGYAISGERTLETFYERLQPFAVPFMALFERDRLPSRSALSRFWQRLPRRLSMPCARSFSTIWRVARSRPTSKPGVCWIAQGVPGWSLTSTARGRRPANALCLRPKSCPLPRADWMTSVLPATPGASVGR